jgi:uncharacterized protein
MTAATIAAVTARVVQSTRDAQEAPAADQAIAAKPTETPATAATNERPVLFDCQGERLLGILHPAAGDTGVVVIVGGPQYRAGSHRLFVQLARVLAAAGHPVLRFDVRGMGDSTGAQRSFEAIGDDIGAAIAQLQQHQPQVQRVVLWGLCDGASAALLYLNEQADARVKGLCLLNPWVRSEASLARTRVKHYYGQRLLEFAFWTKFLRGEVGWRALCELAAGLKAMLIAKHNIHASFDFRERMGRQWKTFEGKLLLMLSEHDYTAREFEECVDANPAWQDSMKSKGLHRAFISAADHTLSTHAAQDQMYTSILAWMAELARSR